MNFIIISIYTLIWLVFSERFSLEIFLVGLFVSSFIYYKNRHLLNLKMSKLSIRYFIIFVEYLLILLVEIIKANIHVAFIVLSPKPNLDSDIITYRTKLKSDYHKMILANSITLTPGTLTISIEENLMKIHCLKKNFQKSIYNSKFEMLLLRIEENYYD